MKFHRQIKLNTILKLLSQLFTDSFLRKILYIVAIVGIVMVTLKVVNGTITMRQYNYGSEPSKQSLLFEKDIGL